MFAFAAQAFVTMFVIIDPPGLAPIFISVAGDRPPEAQRHLARKAIGISAIVLAVFATGGSALFEFLGVSLEAFSIAGGILLFKIAVDMVLAQRHRQTAEEEEESHHRDDVSVFPLAIPLITGPGAFATILVLVGQAGPDPERLGLLAAARRGSVADGLRLTAPRRSGQQVPRPNRHQRRDQDSRPDSRRPGCAIRRQRSVGADLKNPCKTMTCKRLFSGFTG